MLVQEMHVHLSTTPSRIGALDWAAGLVEQLIKLVHRQWKYRNAVNNYKVEGWSTEEHQQIISEMQQLMEVDPSTLLPKFRHLYEDEDFEDLGRGSANNRILWIAAAKSAIAASAIHRRRKHRRRQVLLQQREEEEAKATDEEDRPTQPYSPPQIPREPGFRYKKRHLK